jgi:hypothetical protein
MESVVVSSTEVVVIETDTSNTVTTGTLLGAGTGDGISSISQAIDVDITQLSTGSILVYNAMNAQWKATKLLQEQTIECGQF